MHNIDGKAAAIGPNLNPAIISFGDWL